MNRTIPVTSAYVDAKMRQRAFRQHAQALLFQKPIVDISRPPTVPRLIVYEKRVARERKAQLAMENENIKLIREIEQRRAALRKAKTPHVTKKPIDWIKYMEDDFDHFSDDDNEYAPVTTTKKTIEDDGMVVVIEDVEKNPSPRTAQPVIVRPDNTTVHSSSPPKNVHHAPLEPLQPEEDLSMPKDEPVEEQQAPEDAIPADDFEDDFEEPSNEQPKVEVATAESQIDNETIRAEEDVIPQESREQEPIQQDAIDQLEDDFEQEPEETEEQKENRPPVGILSDLVADASKALKDENEAGLGDDDFDFFEDDS